MAAQAQAAQQSAHRHAMQQAHSRFLKVCSGFSSGNFHSALLVPWYQAYLTCRKPRWPGSEEK
eukprot:5650343-Prymnesium_polylepis.2